MNSVDFFLVLNNLNIFPFTDTNECHLNQHNCSVNANCINMPGSFKCECKNGYTGDGYACNGNVMITNYIFANIITFRY